MCCKEEDGIGKRSTFWKLLPAGVYANSRSFIGLHILYWHSYCNTHRL